MGWQPGTGAPTAEALNDPPKTSDPEDIWDDDSTSTQKGGSSGGLGNAVSMMQHDDDKGRDENTLYGFAIAGDAEGLRAFLDAHPTADMNEIDEYVRAQTCASIALL